MKGTGACAELRADNNPSNIAPMSIGYLFIQCALLSAVAAAPRTELPACLEDYCRTSKTDAKFVSA